MNKPIRNISHRARRVRTVDMLSAEEEHQLLCAWQERGDRRARNRLVAAFAPLAVSVAKRYRPRSGEADPDLVQQANIGLMKAADRFDREREIRFSTYAIWWVRSEVQAYVRANGSVVRRPNSVQSRRAAVQIAGLDAEMSAFPEKNRTDADAQLAAALGVDRRRAAALRAQVTGSDQSLNAPAQGEEGADRLALLVDPTSLEEPLALQKLETAGLRRILVDALAKLPDREREIIIATQVADPPATLKGIGAHYGISKERVRQLRERGFERLRAALRQQDLGLDSFLQKYDALCGHS
ncbi:MAG: sigma-70 family RNA polymerase sigma factor [Pseudomonadota bacterium]